MDFQPLILPTAGLLMMFGIGVFALLKIRRLRNPPEDSHPLMSFREMRERGLLTEEEWAKVKRSISGNQLEASR